MASKFLSAGVFTNEVDLSFLAQGLASIGAVIVSRTPRGPAFVPTLVNGPDDYNKQFGGDNGTDPNFQGTYAAANYLKNSPSVTVVRVLGHADGSGISNGYVVGGIAGIVDAQTSGSVLAVIHHTGSVSGVTAVGVAGDADNFVFKVGTVFAATASFLTSSQNYIGKVLNTDPTKYDTYGHYVYRLFRYAKPAASASWSVDAISGSLNSFNRDFEGATTPWVKSQNFGGTDFDMFRFHSLPHGNAVNGDIKVEISNVKPSPTPSATPFGTFDVVVRKFSDTDQRKVLMEQFVGCTMDPNSQNYIALRIGDHYETFDTTQRKFIGTGDNENKSVFVRVELGAGDTPDEALPFGFRGLSKELFNSGSTVPAITYVADQFDRAGNLDQNIAWGIPFVSGGILDRLEAYPNNVSLLTGSDADFSLTFLSASWLNGKQVWAYNTAVSTLHNPVYGSASLYTFVVPMQGGFDGFDARVTDPLYLSNVDDETVIGVVSAKRAIDTVANPDAFDINVLAVPGVHNIKVTDHGRAMVNDRRDVIYVMDITGSSVAEAVGQLNARELDDNYTACYYPDLKLRDEVNKRNVRVAPSVGVLGALAFNDRVGQPWFAPAGMNRGGLKDFGIFDVVDRTDQDDRDDLYTNRINPIAKFPAEGIVVFGQKTLQVKASALDRVNVRRLLIFAKKAVASAAKLLVFEGNDAENWQKFTNAVNPILNDIRQKRGVNRFKVVMDSSTNTPDLIDRNVMSGKIFLEPTRSAEYLSIDFVVTPSGVAFPGE